MFFKQGLTSRDYQEQKQKDVVNKMVDFHLQDEASVGAADGCNIQQNVP